MSTSTDPNTDIPFTPSSAAASLTPPAHPPSSLATLSTVARRSGYKMLRTPQIAGIAVVQSLVFLFMFRYVIGGAIGVPGVEYVDFLVPGFVVAGILFTGGGGAVGTAEDSESGLFDRLKSLPIHDSATLTGRIIADAALLWVVAVITLAVGFAIGFRLSGPTFGLLGALALLVVYSLAVSTVFTLLGMVSGSAQAAQGLSILAVPFSFISSAFVPVDTMPSWLQWFADWQPLTFMVNSWRGLMLNDNVSATFDHSTSFYVVGSIIWSVVIGVIGMVVLLRAYRKE
jgi:ABC-2 type transport system permease protein